MTFLFLTIIFSPDMHKYKNKRTKFFEISFSISCVFSIILLLFNYWNWFIIKLYFSKIIK